jgi:ATP-dependent DNA helicase DinG
VRLVTKPYGKALAASLPPMRRTRDLAEVEAFFRVESAATARNEEEAS